MTRLLTHKQTFRNPKPDLVTMLAESGPTGQENGAAAKVEPPKKKAAKKEKNVRIFFVFFLAITRSGD